MDYYDVEIGDFMKQSKFTAEILIKHYLAQKKENSKKYYIPKSLKSNQKIEIIDEYIDMEHTNPNYLLLIYKSQCLKTFPINDKIRLKAKKRYESYIEKNLKPEIGLSFGVTIGFANIDEEINCSIKDTLNSQIIYSRIWLKENLDNPTLLNNFIYLFGYVDNFFRSTFPQNKAFFTTIERLTGIKGIREYKIGSFFKFKDMISNTQIRVYYYKLLKLGKRLEDIFKWFFENYLKEEFQAEGFIFSAPTLESSFLEKIRTLCSELDSILRDFMFYVNNGEINRELIEISRNSPLIERIPSFISKNMDI